MSTDEQAITLGHPSYVWRAGQARRFAMIRAHVEIENAHILDAGCGLGLYVQQFLRFSPHVHGVDIDPAKVAEASATLSNIREASAEALPYPDNTFDVVLSHEVLEHVACDAAAVREAYRVLRPGGHLVVFVPNRLYPFETHGAYWRGRYRSGNIPLVNYMPNRWRNQLCPHVRAYTRRQIRQLLTSTGAKIVTQRCIYAGYDNIIARRPLLGRVLRGVTHALERTPLAAFGLSHFVVLKKNTPIPDKDETQA